MLYMEYQNSGQGVNINGTDTNENAREALLDASLNVFKGDMTINGTLYVNEEVIHEITKLETRDPIVELNNGQTLGGVNKDIGWTGKNTTGSTINYKGAIIQKDSDRLIVFNNASSDPNGSGLVAPYDLGTICVRDASFNDEVVTKWQMDAITGFNTVSISNLEIDVSFQLKEKLDKVGGTITGDLSVNGEYTTGTGNIRTTDGNIESTNGMLISGGNIACGGQLNLSNTKITGMANPSIGSDGANKSYVDLRAGLPLTGGTLTGSLTVGNSLTVGGNMLADSNLTVDGNYVSATGDMTLFGGDILVSTGGIKATVGTIESQYGNMICGNHFICGGQVRMNNQRLTGLENPIAGTDGVNLQTLNDKIDDIDLDPNTYIFQARNSGNDNLIELDFNVDFNTRSTFTLVLRYSATADDGSPVLEQRKGVYSFVTRDNQDSAFFDPVYYFGEVGDEIFGVKFDTTGATNKIQIYAKSIVPTQEGVKGVIQVDLINVLYTITDSRIIDVGNKNTVVPVVPNTSIVAFKSDVSSDLTTFTTTGTLTAVPINNVFVERIAFNPSVFPDLVYGKKYMCTANIDVRASQATNTFCSCSVQTSYGNSTIAGNPNGFDLSTDPLIRVHNFNFSFPISITIGDPNDVNPLPSIILAKVRQDNVLQPPNGSSDVSYTVTFTQID